LSPRGERFDEAETGYGDSLLFGREIPGKIGARFSASCFNISGFRPEALFPPAACG
jgi:hypothetical protein